MNAKARQLAVQMSNAYPESEELKQVLEQLK